MRALIVNKNIKKKVVLVVDGNFLSSYLMSKYICEADHHVIWAQNGFEAVKICKTNPGIDLVIMNVDLPELSGVEATRMIKEHRSDLPIILHSASSRFRELLKRADCDEVIDKPVDREIIFEIIKKYLVKNGNVNKILRVLS
jgi:CheY-like chemotaxis protein